MGTRLVRGRTLTPTDHRDRVPAVVVSRTVAESLWPDAEALGKRIRPTGDTANWYEVVGVVEPVLQDGVREAPRPLVYYPMLSPDGDEGWGLRTASYVIEAESPAELAGTVRAAVWEMDPDLPLADVRTMEDIVAQSRVELSFTMVTLGVAALLALLLGAVGLYGVLSYAVAQRTQEIGVRMALGAQAPHVLAMVVRDGAITQGIGLLVGLAGAAALTSLLQGMLYGVEPLDPLTFAATSALLLAVGLLAAYLPARRAAAVEPSVSMRGE
jgi:predicted lysophospholipase L1 biosynthesis ABC-type transport system permease subunit